MPENVADNSQIKQPIVHQYFNHDRRRIPPHALREKVKSNKVALIEVSEKQILRNLLESRGREDDKPWLGFLMVFEPIFVIVSFVPRRDQQRR